MVSSDCHQVALLVAEVRRVIFVDDGKKEFWEVVGEVAVPLLADGSAVEVVAEAQPRGKQLQQEIKDLYGVFDERVILQNEHIVSHDLRLYLRQLILILLEHGMIGRNPRHLLLQILFDVVELTEVVDRSAHPEMQILQTQEEELCNCSELLALFVLFDGFGVDWVVFH